MKNKKKKSVFLAGLMAFMMMVSLLSGINLGVVKAEETETKPNNLFDTAGKTFTLLKSGMLSLKRELRLNLYCVLNI